MTIESKRRIYVKPSAKPIQNASILPKPDQKLQEPIPITKTSPQRVPETIQREIFTVATLAVRRTPQLYRSGYMTGFSQALKVMEYLLSRGLSMEAVITNLHELLEENIRPLCTEGVSKE